MYKKNIIIYSLSIILLLVILLTSFNIEVHNLDIYNELHEETGVYSYFNESLAEKKSIELISFFKTDSSLDKEFYTFNEISHLNDVKKIFGFLKIFNFVLVLLLISGLIYLYYQEDFLQSLIKIIFIQLIICLVLLLLAYIIPFDFLFEKMHELFFPQGNYSFDSSSNLINLFPIGFFIGFFEKILRLFFVIELVLFHIWMLMYAKKNKGLFKKIFK